MTKRRKRIATENREPFLSIEFTLMSARLLVEKVKHYYLDLLSKYLSHTLAQNLNVNINAGSSYCPLMLIYGPVIAEPAVLFFGVS